MLVMGSALWRMNLLVLWTMESNRYFSLVFCSSEPYLEVYSNLYYLLAQSEEMNATDKWAGFVLTKEGEEFVQQNAKLIKYDLIYNLLRLESWQKLANIYDEVMFCYSSVSPNGRQFSTGGSSYHALRSYLISLFFVLLLGTQEVDLLLNDGSKQINVLGWRKNAALSERVEASRRRSRRCLLMTSALAKTADQQVCFTLIICGRRFFFCYI